MFFVWSLNILAPSFSEFKLMSFWEKELFIKPSSSYQSYLLSSSSSKSLILSPWTHEATKNHATAFFSLSGFPLPTKGSDSQHFVMCTGWIKELQNLSSRLQGSWFLAPPVLVSPSSVRSLNGFKISYAVVVIVLSRRVGLLQAILL